MGTLLRGVTFVLKQIIPVANPDYDDRIGEVHTWLVEIDETSLYPKREIGLDSTGRVSVRLPDEQNYGYWTDNNLYYQDFLQQLNAERIDEKIFQSRWSEVTDRDKPI